MWTIDVDSWCELPLERSEPPEDCCAPMDLSEPDDLGYSDTEMSAADWTRALEQLRTEGESWQDTGDEDERDPLGDGTPVEAYIAEEAAAAVAV